MARFLAICLIFSGFLATSAAMPPLSRSFESRIVQVDSKQHFLTLEPQAPGKPTTFIWTNETRFLRNNEFTNAGELRKNLWVKAYYRSPFFGRKFLTKVILEKQ